jgi:gliding motility-associated-like protein
MDRKWRFHCSLLIWIGLIFFGFTSRGQSSCQEDCLDIFLPNVITPNGDGINDFFTISFGESSCPCEIKEVSLVVYNRWGKEVFYFFDPDYAFNELKWRGETGEKEVSESCYYYRAEINFKQLQSRVLKGWVRIIRESKI